MKVILRGSEDNALATFNSSHRSIKDAIKRASDLEKSLNAPCLVDLERARQALGTAWPFLRQEADVSDELRAKAAALEDLLARETFFKELPSIEQHATALEVDYERRFEEAIAARIAAYTKAFDRLVKTHGWSDVGEDQQRRLGAPFERGKSREEVRLPIPQVRSEPLKQAVLVPGDEAAGGEFKDQPAIHLLVEVEIERVQGLPVVAEAGLRDAALEEPVLAAQELVLDERGEEVDGGQRRGLGLEQPRLEPGGHARAAELTQGVLQLDEVHVGISSWVLRAITSR
jgi:hypothetical protein